MFISPKVAIERGWVTHPECKTIVDFENKKFISPNAIDFTLDRLFSIDSYSTFVISESTKQMRKTSEMFPSHDDTGQLFWTLYNAVYDGVSNFHVNIPEGIAALLVVRSTFNRNGIFITSGLYDQGYIGSCGMAIHNRGGIALIASGTRIGQLIFVESGSSGQMYLGQYNTDSGKHWSEKP